MSQSTTAAQTGFVAEEFETSVAEETTTQLAHEIEEIVRSLRTAMTDDYFDLVLRKYDELADHQIDEEQEVEQ